MEKELDNLRMMYFLKQKRVTIFSVRTAYDILEKLWNLRFSPSPVEKLWNLQF